MEKSVYYPFTIRLKRPTKAFKRFSHPFSGTLLTYPFKKISIRLTFWTKRLNR